LKATGTIESALTAIGIEFGDEAHPRVSARRAENLRRRGTLSVDEFLDAVEEAREVTLAHRSAVVRRQRATAGDLGRKNLMPYFFATLEGLTEPEEEDVSGCAISHPAHASGAAPSRPSRYESNSPTGNLTLSQQAPALQPSTNGSDFPKGNPTHAPQAFSPKAMSGAATQRSKDGSNLQEANSAQSPDRASQSNKDGSDFPKGNRNHPQEILARTRDTYTDKAATASSGRAETLWQAVLAELRDTLAAAAYQRWLASTRVLRCDGATLEIAVRDVIQQHWLAERLRARIEDALSAAGAAGLRLCYIVSDGA
jgi:hypothetical protein